MFNGPLSRAHGTGKRHRCQNGTEHQAGESEHTEQTLSCAHVYTLHRLWGTRRCAHKANIVLQSVVDVTTLIVAIKKRNPNPLAVPFFNVYTLTFMCLYTEQSAFVLWHNLCNHLLLLRPGSAVRCARTCGFADFGGLAGAPFGKTQANTLLYMHDALVCFAVRFVNVQRPHSILAHVYLRDPGA